MSNVFEHPADYTQPPHMAKQDLVGCGDCGGFNFLINTDGGVTCNSCGSPIASLHVTYNAQAK